MTTIALDQIVVGKRLRAHNPKVVDQIAASFTETGQMQAIVVLPAENGKHLLVAGAHRIAAARQLGWKKIAAIIMPSLPHAMLAEIDENLVRGDLSAIERSVHHSERKRIHEELHPETKLGATGVSRPKKVPQNAEPKPAARYTADASAKTGKSEATVQREVARGVTLAQLGVDATALVGTSIDNASDLDRLGKIAQVTPELARQLAEKAASGSAINVKAEAKKLSRQTRETELAEKIEKANDFEGLARYGVIYADPPWDYLVRSEHGKDRSAENHYPVMTMQQLLDLKIDDIAAADAILFLWTTTPMLAQAIDCIDHWGFTYRSALVWDKQRLGTGYWFRDQTEHLLVAARGEVVAPAAGSQLASLWSEARGKHSVKPTGIRDWIATTWPSVPKVELFARSAAEGWDTWGAEAPSLTAA